MFAYVEERARANPHIQLLLSLSSFSFSVLADEDTTYVTVKNGQLQLSQVPPLEKTNFSLIASRDTWAAFLSDEPGPGFQTLSTMRRRHHMTVEGDVGLFFQQMLLLEMLFSRLDAGAQEPKPAQAGLEPVTGRYLRLNIQGIPHRVYFEEAGSGPPLLVCIRLVVMDGNFATF